MSKIVRFSDIFLIGLLFLPTDLFLAVIVAGVMVYLEVGIAWIVFAMFLVLMIIPLAILIYFLIIRQKVYENFDLRIITTEKEFKIYHLQMKIEMKNVLHLCWINIKELRHEGKGFIRAIQEGQDRLYDQDLKPYLAEQVKLKYGLDDYKLVQETDVNRVSFIFK